MELDLKSIAQDVKRSVSMVDVCKQYGLEVNRSGFAKCCFHADKNPSMKVYENGVKCFACGESADHFAIVQQLTGCDFITALRMIIQDFSLPYDIDNLDDNRQKELEEKLRLERLKRHKQEQEELKCLEQFHMWQDIYTLYDNWLTQYEPLWPDEEPDNRYVEACKNIDYAFEMMMQASIKTNKLKG